MRKIIIGLLLLLSVGATAQWQQTGSKVRYVNGLGIPTKDTAAGVAADSSQILIRPADSSLYVKYKRTWLRVGGGGGSIAGSGTTNYIPKFTSSTAIGNSSIFDNGNVGIGTASPARKLTVSGNAGSAMIGLENVGIDYYGIGMPSGTGDMAFYSSATTERMRITSGGNTLIGTTTDNGVDKLQVNGSSYYSGQMQQRVTSPRFILDDADNTGTASLWFRPQNASFNIRGALELISFGSAAGGELRMSSGASGGAVTASQYQTFYTAGVERVRITSAGRILANTTTDNTVDQLQVNGSILSTQFKLSALNTAPASATAAGTLGEIRIDANYIYICTATNTWKRVAIATW